MSQAGGMRARALVLTAANIFDYALQTMLPILLVRLLDTKGFADYRLAWLVIGTAMAIAPFFMAGSLWYFLPRVPEGERRLYVNQSLLFLGASGAVAGLLASSANPFLPVAVSSIQGGGWFLPAFLGVWIAGSIIDMLPNAEQRVTMQARIISLLAVARVVMAGAGALTGNLEVVFAFLLAYGFAKLTTAVLYVGKFHGFRIWMTSKVTWGAQLRYVLPFGFASGLFLLRGQTDQWVAATVFQPAQFAAFSVAAVVMPFAALIRTSANSAITPRLSALQASGNVAGMIGLNARANAVTALVLLPFLGLVFVLAEPIVEVLFTRTYLAAAEVMRVNVLGLACAAVEAGTLMVVLNQGRFRLAVDFVMLPLGVAASFLGGAHYGLPGAAIGGALTLLLSNGAYFWRVAQMTGVGIKEIQDWASILCLGAAAVIAAVIALGVASALAGIHPLLRMLGVSPVFLVIYFAAIRGFGGWGLVSACLRRDRAGTESS